MKNKKILSFAIIFTFVICALCLVGCSETNTNSTLNNIMMTMSKISNTLDNVQTINTNELIIEDFMNEDELARIDSQNYVDKVATNGAMNSYIAKISALNNNVITTIEVNSSINNSKRQIYAKASQIKALCSQNISAKVELKGSQIKTLNELNNTLIANNTRISLTRNEITNNFKNVNSLKGSYSSKPEQLNSRYTRLKTSLNTRLSYYNNLLNGLDEMSNILCDTDCFKHICDDYIIDEELYKKSTNDNSVKTGITKNIDTYENAGTNIYGDYRNNPIYNPDNYLKNVNPGYGMYGPNGYGFGNYGIGGYGMNGYGGYGMNGFGMGGYNGFYGYGMPYGNGYLYPNINTFGTYKNIDTYRSRKDLNKQEQDINLYEEYSEDKTADNSEKVMLPDRQSDCLPNDNRPKPIPYRRNNNVNEEFKTEEEEDQFVDKLEKPSIKKIDENIED